MATVSNPSSSFVKEKQCLGWKEWLKGWYHLTHEMLFQRIMARHLQNPLPLPHLDDVTCIVTGSTSGIGLEIARQLADAGAHVVMAVRNTKAAHDLIQNWQNEQAKTKILNIEVMELNLLSLDSVVRFSESWNSRSKPLHILINNAGIFSIGEPQKFSENGYEQHMQVNHLAPALLSILLLPSLIQGSPSRIINVSSVVHLLGFVDPQDMNFVSGKTKFSSFKGYTSSKLAQVMFNTVLQKRLPPETGVTVVCVSPGVVQTNVARDIPKILQVGYHMIPYIMFNSQEGSRSTLFAATDSEIVKRWPVCAFISSDCRLLNPSEEVNNIQTANKVWEKTLDLIGLPSDAVEKILEGEFRK